MLDRGLGAGVDGIKRRVGTKQRGHQGADLAVVIDVLASLLEKKEGRFRIDRPHRVIFGFRNLDDRLFQNLSNRVDCDVRCAHGGDGVRKKLLHCARSCQIGLKGGGLCPRCLDCLHGFLRVSLCARAVVVDCDRPRAMLGDVPCDRRDFLLRPRRERFCR